MGLSITILESAQLGVTITEPFNVTLTPTSPATLNVEVGVPGASATVAVGTTTTLAPGLNATVTNVGTASNAILDFGIPKGEKGDKGDTGDSGVAYATAPLSYDSGTKTISIDLSSYATQAWVDAQGYLQAGALTGYATQSWVTSQGYITADALTPYALISSLGSAAYQNTSYWIQSPLVAAVDGQIVAWDAATSRPIWIDNDARTLFLVGVNKSGVTIPKGAAVYISGGQGGTPIISLAQANSEATSSLTIGVTTADIANNAQGTVVTAGLATKLDTSAYAEGQILYLSATVAGGFTTTLPTQPLHGVVIGYVTRQHAVNGTIEVRIQNYQELGELSDVLLSSKANLDLLSWDSAAGVWKNKSFSTLGLLTSATAASTYELKAPNNGNYYVQRNGAWEQLIIF